MKLHHLFDGSLTPLMTASFDELSTFYCLQLWKA